MTDQQIEQLQEERDELANLVQSLQSSSKQIGSIVSGPFTENGKTYYRVSSGGDQQIFSTSVKIENDLEPGDEVAIMAEGDIRVIYETVPDLLKIKKPEADFDLITWADIAGLDSQIEEIQQAIELPLKHADKAEMLNIPALKGILLYGPPGCGKTLIAKAIASRVLGENGKNPDSFIYIKGAELLSRYVGDTENSIRQIFEQSREYTKQTGSQGLIFIDEAEALLSSRGSRRSSDVDMTIVPTFLSEMDGFEGNSPLVVLSTNIPAALDSAIIRPGRIDLKIEINRPSKDDAKDVYALYLSKTEVRTKSDTLVEKAVDLVFSSHAKDMVSGSFIEKTVEYASRNSLKRHIADDSPLGIVWADLEKSIINLSKD